MSVKFRHPFHSRRVEVSVGFNFDSADCINQFHHRAVIDTQIIIDVDSKLILDCTDAFLYAVKARMCKLVARPLARQLYIIISRYRCEKHFMRYRINRCNHVYIGSVRNVNRAFHIRSADIYIEGFFCNVNRRCSVFRFYRHRNRVKHFGFFRNIQSLHFRIRAALHALIRSGAQENRIVFAVQKLNDCVLCGIHIGILNGNFSLKLALCLRISKVV